ncbi:FAD-dependent monooxygenase [Streptomyces sp. NPDC055189]
MDAAVIVVGAGPTGMTLAAELRLAGAEVIVLERLAQRTGESRGLGFTARTMEVFAQRGLLPRFKGLELNNLGHFGGLPVDFGVLAGHRAAKAIPQSVTETVLEEWAVQLGADIRRRHEVLSLRQTDEAAEVTVRGPEGEQTLRARYVVGCDGGRSLIRKKAGFEFPGTSATLEMFLADVRGVELEPRLIGETLAGGMVMVGPMPGGVTRLIICERGTPPQRRTTPPSWEEVATAWKRLTGSDISHAEPVWLSSFGDATRLATEYRRGRVLLAGDAAHIHLPAGGQGMNTGIQDAMNLGWKLGAVVRDRAPEGLLDSYHAERHPVGERLMLNTRAQGLLFLSGPEVQPVRDVLAELIRYPEVSRHLAGMVSGLEIRYDVGGGSSPLLGSRIPPAELTRRADGSAGGSATDTHRELHRARGTLFDFADSARLRERARPWRDRVDIVTAAPRDQEAAALLHGTSAALVRPDGYVAWAAPGTHCGLSAALNRWFGPAAPSATT